MIVATSSGRVALRAESRAATAAASDSRAAPRSSSSLQASIPGSSAPRSPISACTDSTPLTRAPAARQMRGAEVTYTLAPASPRMNATWSAGCVG